MTSEFDLAAGTAVVRYARELGIPAAAIGGSAWLHGGRVVIKVKSRRERPSDEAIARMWQEAMREADRVPQCDVAMLVLKRPSKTAPALWWAVMSPAAWLWLDRIPGCVCVRDSMSEVTLPDPDGGDLLTMSLGSVASRRLRHLPPRQHWQDWR